MYDVIVIGARCAGAPTAMLLARNGYKVLLADKVSFPRDTVSTHYIHQPGVAKLKKWGVLDSLQRSNCPQIRDVSIFSGPSSLRSLFMNFNAVGDAYCPRRTILDNILLEAAAQSGAEVRENFHVKELSQQDRTVNGILGRSERSNGIREQARIVVGADGVNSIVARTMQARQYNVSPMRNCYVYAYWSGVNLLGGEIYFRNGRAATAFPTHDGLACITVVWPTAVANRLRQDLQNNYLKTIKLFPQLHARTREGRQEKGMHSTTGRFPNFFRIPYGLGWALVGDAGYHKDPITALGISDAFRDAEFLAEAIHKALSGRQSLDRSLAKYEQRRNEAARPLYEFTLEIDRLGSSHGQAARDHRGSRSGQGGPLRMEAGSKLYFIS
jgi:2-polyprenyl-6-methoxyphenol hydroxylase-like FAD-dependent oxidoreductase